MICENCIYRKNCQFLAKRKKAEVIDCTAFVSEADFVKKAKAEAVREYSHKVIDYICEICVMPDIAIEMANGIDNLAKEFAKDIDVRTNPEQPKEAEKETTTAKHRVGDRVRVRYDLSVGDYGNAFCNTNMVSQAGKILTIAKEPDSFGRYKVKECGYIWNDLMFEYEMYGNPEEVKCKDCKHLMYSDCYGECSQGYKGIVQPDDSCKYGERKLK